ncbi:MAG: PAS domain S-box protein [Flavobacteriales bacterium]|nr:PAS domain S-box protein [Flavobacteriales bacterium]
MTVPERGFTDVLDMTTQGSGTVVVDMGGQELAEAYLRLKHQYEELVLRSVAGIYRSTLDGRILECNDAIARMLGYSDRDEFMRQPADAFYTDPADREALINALREHGRLVNHPLRLKDRNGRQVEALLNVYLVEWKDRPATMQGTLIDVTAWRQSEMEQRMLLASYRGLVEHVRDGLLVIAGGRIVYANPAAEALVGRPLTGEAVMDVFHMDARNQLEHLMHDATQAGPITTRLASGREVVLFASAVQDEGGSAIRVTLQDHSEQQVLMKERMRVQLAEEVNQVLRQEISEHRRTQEALRRSRRFARNLIDSSLDMIMAADPEGRITEYNPAASLRFGYEAEEVMGRDTRMLYADLQEYEAVQRELDEHGAFTGEIRNLSKDGQVFTTFLASSRLHDEDGRIIGVMGVSRDITRQKQDQEALRASEERYRDLFENATDLILSVDADGRLLYVNQAWHKAMGCAGGDPRGRHISEMLHPDHAADHAPLFTGEGITGGDAQVSAVFKGAEGRKVIAEGSITVRRENGRVVATRAILRDITHVLAAKEELQRNEAKLRALFESSEHMFWTVDPGIRITSYNHGYAGMIERLHGVRPQANAGPVQPREGFSKPNYRAFWDAKYAKAFSGQPVRFETDVVDMAGQRVCNEIFLSPVFGTDGRVKEVFGIGHEITEQKEAEELIREQAARLRAIFESSANMMIWTLDEGMRITSCNRWFLGSAKEAYDIDFSIGDHFVERLAPRASGDPGPFMQRFKAALKGKPQQFEVELLDTKGEPRWVECFISPIVVDGHVRELSCLAYGITDRKREQMELERSLHEKEVLLKEVHHRVKNNLQIVSSIFNLQTGHVGDDPRIRDLLRESRDRIRSMAFIHESLYQNKDFSSIDLAGYIEGLSRNLMHSYSLDGRVALETALRPVELVLDQAIPCGLILNEIISNALKHAFPGGRAGKVRIELDREGELVMVRIADDGQGLPQGFDPRRDGNLGLELVHTLVEQLEGDIRMSGGPGVAYLLTFERIKH